MIDSATIARMIATTALAFGISASTASDPEVRSETTSCLMLEGHNARDSDHEMSGESFDSGLIPALPRSRAISLWI